MKPTVPSEFERNCADAAGAPDVYGVPMIRTQMDKGDWAILAVLALIWGGVHLMVGTLVRRRRHWSRHAALMLGAVDLLLLPYGTALGVYSLWILLREDAKRLFETPAAVGTP